MQPLHRFDTFLDISTEYTRDEDQLPMHLEDDFRRTR